MKHWKNLSTLHLSRENLCKKQYCNVTKTNRFVLKILEKLNHFVLKVRTGGFADSTENGTPVTKEKTVAFSGHRTNRIAKFTADREKLFREVSFDTFVAIESYCIKKGYHTFLSGMCEDFDLIAAEEVLNLKKEYPHIHLKCVVPFKGQAERYTQADKRRYDTILAQADEVVTLQDGYTEGCFLRRNNYLLENSAFLMVYYDSVAVGGTFYTLKRAVEQKKKFANVCYNRR